MFEDCSKAIAKNMRYSKALERRSKCLRKLAAKTEDLEDKVAKLTQCMEDITSVCILEGFQRQEHMMLVDAILKELGKSLYIYETILKLISKIGTVGVCCSSRQGRSSEGREEPCAYHDVEAFHRAVLHVLCQRSHHGGDEDSIE